MRTEDQNHCCVIPLHINLLNSTGYVRHHQFNIQQLYSLPTLYFSVLYLSQNKGQRATYTINWLDFITEKKSVYSAVRTGSLNKSSLRFVFKGSILISSKAFDPICHLYMYGLLQLYPELQKGYKVIVSNVKTIPFTHVINCIVDTSATISVDLVSTKGHKIVLRNVTKDWIRHSSF
jgi:hypothetical protein